MLVVLVFFTYASCLGTCLKQLLVIILQPARPSKFLIEAFIWCCRLTGYRSEWVPNHQHLNSLILSLLSHCLPRFLFHIWTHHDNYRLRSKEREFNNSSFDWFEVWNLVLNLLRTYTIVNLFTLLIHVLGRERDRDREREKKTIGIEHLVKLLRTLYTHKHHTSTYTIDTQSFTFFHFHFPPKRPNHITTYTI